MNDAQIMAFLTVADTLNFTKAANQLYLTQQAVSKYINELEHALNLVLFERTKTAVRLTPEGEILSRLFREVAGDYYNVREKINNHYRQLEFKLKIGISEMIDPFGEIWGGISDFISRNPNTVFYGGQLMVSRIQEGLNSGDYDIVITSQMNVPLGDEYRTEPVAGEKLCLFGPANICRGEFDESCWGLPLIQQASWEWGFFAWNKIGPSRLAKLNLHPVRYLGVPNMASLVSEMYLDRFVTLAGGRFSGVNKIPGLVKFPLKESSEVCCTWNKRNENPLLPRFAREMREYYHYGSEEA